MQPQFDVFTAWLKDSVMAPIPWSISQMIRRFIIGRCCGQVHDVDRRNLAVSADSSSDDLYERRMMIIMTIPPTQSFESCPIYFSTPDLN